MNPRERSIDVGLLLRRGIPLALACALLAGVAAYLLSSAREDEFEASSLVLLRDVYTDPAFGESAAPGGDEVTATNVLLASRRRIFESVARQPGVDADVEALRRSVSASAEGGTNVARITAVRPTAQSAALVANSVAREFVRARQAGARSRAAVALRVLRRQFRQLSERGRGTESGLRLRERIDDLEVVQRIGLASPSVVEFATPPTEARAPRPRRDAILGGLFGLALGLGVAVALVQADRRVRRPEAAEAASGLPLLAIVTGRPQAGSVGDAVGTHGLQPYRLLRANLRHRVGGGPVRSVGVVDAGGPVDDAREVARGLALAAGSEGERALLAMTSAAPAARAGVPEPVAAGDGVDRGQGSGSLRWRLDQLDHEGQVALLDVDPADSASVGAAAELGDVLREAEDDFELVVLHAPAPTQSPGAIPSLERLRGVVVVVPLGRTATEDLDRMGERLESLGLRPVGIVATRA
jgi:capsular polysaccharide biosynthesis protein